MDEETTMTRKAPDRPGSPKLGKGERQTLQAPQNERLTQQTRKQLGKHYANKYRTGRG